MTNKVKILIALTLLATAFAAGRYTLPTKVVEKEHIIYQDKIVTVVKTVKQKDESDHKVYVKITTVKPDGTKTSETRIYDDRNIEITQKQQSNTVDTSSKAVDKEKDTTYNTQSLLVAGLVRINPSDFTYSYGLSVNKRILGPIYLGVFGFTDKTLGLSGGLAF